MEQIMRLSVLVAIVAAGAVLAGCAQTYERQAALVAAPVPMTTEEVAAAANAGASESNLVAQLEQRGYVGTLTTDDVDQLRADGVPDPVIDWMLAHPEPAAPFLAEGPEVVYVEREPRVSSTVSVGFGSGITHRRRVHRHEAKRDRDRDDDEDDGSHTRTIQGKNGRVYRYTSGK